MQNVFELIAQMVELQKKITPLLPKVSQKLVSDLIDSGTSPTTIGKAIGRSGSHMKKVADARHPASLSSGQIVEIIRKVSGGAK